MSAAALRLGVGAEYVSSLSLYASRDGCDRRIDPATPAGALKKCDALVLAVRLVTGRSAAALRGRRRGHGGLPAAAGRPRRSGLDGRAPGRAAPVVARAGPRGEEAVRDGGGGRRAPAGDHAAGDARRETFAPRVRDVGDVSNGVLRDLDALLVEDERRQAKAAAAPEVPGTSSGGNAPAGPSETERAQLERQGIEIEIVESVEDVQYFNDGAKPESDFLELVSSLPLYGAALFPCAVRRRAAGERRDADDDAPKSAVANRVLAISREGAAVLTADLRTELQLIPMNKLRRWHAALDSICFESEKPFDHWSPNFLRRRSADGETQAKRKRLRRLAATARGKVRARVAGGDEAARAGGDRAKARPKSWTSWATALLGGAEAKSEREKPLPPPPASLSDEEDESSDSDLEAPMQRVRFELLLVERPGQVGYRSREIVDLLDDYSVFDLVEDRPRPVPLDLRHGPAHERDVARRPGDGGHVGADGPEGGGALGDQPTVRNAPCPRSCDRRGSSTTRLLGPSSFEFGGKRFRHDLVIRNQHGLRLHCSHWRPAAPEHQRAAARPCVVFMHANSASRIQACSYLPVALSLGCSMFAFDCCGSGVSDGTYVSLGYHEADDLLVALTHLRKRKDTGPLVVWGHSMGAASVIYYQGRYRGSYPRIDAAVLDSPYADFEELANHLVKQNSAVATGSLGKYVVGFSLTRMALNLVLESIDASCLQLAKFSPLKDLSPISHAATCVTPALFMQARSDRIIALSHVEGLANRYGGTRKLAIVDGTHSSPRNGAARHFIAMYLKKNVKLPPEAARPDTRNRDRYLELSPWHRPRSALPPCT
ncbi:palmitoyl-(protein) hydrolase [Aureococcus anophagefferens]|nr:palmitoyl-(protein) hydrolase [Aureococcus anophagefferens]